MSRNIGEIGIGREGQIKSLVQIEICYLYQCSYQLNVYFELVWCFVKGRGYVFCWYWLRDGERFGYLVKLN